MSKKCVLHIGMPKTGSSSIQSTLSSNHERLRNKWNVEFYHKLDNHSFLAGLVEDAFLNDPMFLNLGGPVAEERKVFCDLLRLDFEHYIAKSESGTHVISGEILCLLDGQAVLRLKIYLDQFFDEVKVVIYVREHLSCLSSLAQQSVRAGKTFYQIEQNYRSSQEANSSISDFCIVPNYQRMISNYQLHFGESQVIVKDFTALTQNGIDIAQDFLKSVLKISDSDLTTMRSNDGLDYTVTHILESLNHSTPLFIGDYLNPMRARTLTSRLKQISPQTKFVMRGVDWNDIKTRTLEDSTWLKQVTKGQIDYAKAAMPAQNDLSLSGLPIDGLGAQLNGSLLEAERAKQRAAIVSGLAELEGNAGYENAIDFSPFMRVCLVHSDVKFILNIALRLKRLKYFKLAHILASNVRRVSPEPEDHAKAAKFLATLPLQNYSPARLRFDLHMGNSITWTDC